MLIMLLQGGMPACGSEGAPTAILVAQSSGFGRLWAIPGSSEAFFSPKLEGGLWKLSVGSATNSSVVLGSAERILWLKAVSARTAWVVVQRGGAFVACHLRQGTSADPLGWRIENELEVGPDDQYAASEAELWSWHLEVATNGQPTSVVRVWKPPGSSVTHQLPGVVEALIHPAGAGSSLVATRDRAALRVHVAGLNNHQVLEAVPRETPLLWDRQAPHWLAMEVKEGWRLWILSDDAESYSGLIAFPPVEVVPVSVHRSWWVKVRQSGRSLPALAVGRNRQLRMGFPTVDHDDLTALSEDRLTCWRATWANTPALVEYRIDPSIPEGFSQQVLPHPAMRRDRTSLLVCGVKPADRTIWSWGGAGISCRRLDSDNAWADDLTMGRVLGLWGTLNPNAAWALTDKGLYWICHDRSGLASMGPLTSVFRLSGELLPHHVQVEGATAWINGWNGVFAAWQPANLDWSVRLNGQRASPGALTFDIRPGAADARLQIEFPRPSQFAFTAPSAPSLALQPSRLGPDDGAAPRRAELALSSRKPPAGVRPVPATLLASDGPKTDWLLDTRELAAGGNDTAILNLQYSDPTGSAALATYTLRIIPGSTFFERYWLGLPRLARGAMLGVLLACVFLACSLKVEKSGKGGRWGSLAPLAPTLPALVLSWGGACASLGIAQLEATVGASVGMALLVLTGLVNAQAFSALCDVQPLRAMVPFLLISAACRRRLAQPHLDQLVKDAAAITRLPSPRRYMPLPLASREDGVARTETDPVPAIQRVAFELQMPQRGNVLIYGPGGTGKSALLREVVERMTANLRDGKWLRIPVVCPPPAAPEDLPKRIENILKRTLPGSVAAALVQGGYVAVCMDGAETCVASWINEVVVRDSAGMAFIFASRPSPEHLRAFERSAARGLLALATSNWTQSQLDQFLAAPAELGAPTDRTSPADSQALSPGLLAACKLGDGSYSPLLVCLALRTKSGTTVTSRYGLYLSALDQLLGTMKLIQKCAQWVFHTYGSTGIRGFQWAGIPSEIQSELLSSKLIDSVNDSGQGAPREGQFVHDELQTFLAAYWIATLPPADWTEKIEKILLNPSFRDVAPSDPQPSSFIAMCCDVLAPPQAICRVFEDIGQRWAGQLEDVLTIEDVAVLQANRAQARTMPPIHFLESEIARLRLECKATQFALLLDWIARRHGATLLALSQSEQ